MARSHILKQPLRVALVGVRWPPETFIARKVSELIAAGMVVTVCTSDGLSKKVYPDVHHINIPSLKNKRSLIKAIVPLLWQAILSPTYARCAMRVAFGRQRGFALNLIEFLRLMPFARHKFDVIHFEWNSAAIEFEPLFDLLDCAFVISCRGSQVQVAPHNPVRMVDIAAGLRSTFGKASAVHCVSDAILNEATKYGLDSKKAHIIRPAVDPSYFVPPVSRTENVVPLVVTTGSLIWRKGLEYLLQAVCLLKNSGIDLCLDIMGDGPERQRIVYTIDDLDVGDRVILSGRLPPEQVRDRLQQADVFVLSSLSEGISNAVLEAMACGVPVVTTDCGGMHEAVTHGVEGFVVPLRDPQALSEALATLVLNPDLRAEMGQAGRERILRDFTLEHQVASLLELYISLVDTRRISCAASAVSSL